MSTLKVSTIKSNTASTPPSFQDTNGVEVGQLCRAWINFNGNGTVAIRDDYFCSSLTDNGTGDYTVTFDSALSSTDYAPVFGAFTRTDGSCTQVGISTTDTTNAQLMSTTQLRVRSEATTNGADFDCAMITVAIFGD